MRVIVGESVVCLVSVYAPQVGRVTGENEEFLTSLLMNLTDIDPKGKLIIDGALNGHVTMWDQRQTRMKECIADYALEEGTWKKKCCWKSECIAINSDNLV